MYLKIIKNHFVTLCVKLHFRSISMKGLKLPRHVYKSRRVIKLSMPYLVNLRGKDTILTRPQQSLVPNDGEVKIKSDSFPNLKGK